MIKLWGTIEGTSRFFGVLVSPDSDVDELRNQIYKEHLVSMVQYGPTDLTLAKLQVHIVDLAGVRESGYRPNVNDQRRLQLNEKIYQVWPESPRGDQLHVIVRVPAPNGSPTLVHEGGVDSNFVREYEDFVIQLEDWKGFEGSDIERNDLEIYRDRAVPDFVAKFEQELDKKPGLAPDAYSTYKSIRNVEFSDVYFGKRCVEDRSDDEFTFEGDPHRYVDYFEATHLQITVDCPWQKFWDGSLGVMLEEPSVNAMFSYLFALAASETGKTSSILTGNQSWPLILIAKCFKEQHRTFQPRSNLLVSKFNLPRLLVEVNSKPKTLRPEDLVRMLLTGAAIVRFANKFLDAFMVHKNFVLFAIYIWDDGRATRYSIFQEPDNSKVYCRQIDYWWRTPIDRAKFLRQMYNLLHVLEVTEETGDTEMKIRELKTKIEQYANDHRWKSLHTGTGNTGGTGGVNEGECAELEAYGYEVELPDYVDESGYALRSLIRMPSHILTVYHQMVPGSPFNFSTTHVATSSSATNEHLAHHMYGTKCWRACS